MLEEEEDNDGQNIFFFFTQSQSQMQWLSMCLSAYMSVYVSACPPPPTLFNPPYALNIPWVGV